MKQRNPRSPGKTHGKKETFEETRFGKWFSKFWERHWGIIVTAILALIIGIIFIPMISRGGNLTLSFGMEKREKLLAL